MKIILIPIWKIIAFIFLFLMMIFAHTIMIVCQFIWSFKVNFKMFEYVHLYPKNMTEQYMHENGYSPFFNHNKYKNEYHKLVFKSNFHFLLCCEPSKKIK